MRNWDPLSIFKYLTGSPTLHAVMLIQYRLTEKFEPQEGVLRDELKVDLIDKMFYAHLFVILSFFIFEIGLFEMIMGRTNIVIPAASLFIQILCYQGLVFEQMNFFMYVKFPNTKFDGEFGVFHEFDRWDILILFDIVFFLANLLTIMIFTLGSVYPGELIREKIPSNDPEGKEKDYFEEAIDHKKFIVQINSLAIVNVIIFVLIFTDVYQVHFNLQWVVLFCEGAFFLGVLTNGLIFVITGSLVILRTIIVIIWGGIILKTHEKTQQNKVAYNLVLYLVWDSLLFIPFNLVRLGIKALRTRMQERSHELTKQQTINESMMADEDADGMEEGGEKISSAPKKVEETQAHEYQIPRYEGGDEMDVKEPEDDHGEGKMLTVDMSIYGLTFASMIKGITVKYELNKYVEDYFFKATMIFFIQVLIIFFIANAALNE